MHTWQLNWYTRMQQGNSSLRFKAENLWGASMLKLTSVLYWKKYKNFHVYKYNPADWICID